MIIIRRLISLLSLILLFCVLTFGFLSLGSRLYTQQVLARWDKERAELRGPLLTLPPADEDHFDSTTTLAFLLGCVAPQSTIIAAGPTTIKRADPVTPPSGQQQIETELIEMTLQGTLYGGTLVGPVEIREDPNRVSPGRITELKAGTDFPAESFFDVFIEVDIMGVTLINKNPVPMRRIINEIPPLLIDYLPPPDLMVHLYDKSSDIYWGCMTHPKHGTLPPIIKIPSIPDPLGPDIVTFTITIKNPYAANSILVQLADAVPFPDFQLQPPPPEIITGPVSNIEVMNPDTLAQQIIWGAPSDPTNQVNLNPLQQVVIEFHANVTGTAGAIIPNIIQVDSPPLGLDPSTPITVTQLVLGGKGNMTSSKKEAQPFVESGGRVTYTIELSNSGVNGAAHITLSDFIPPNTSYVVGTVTGGANYNAGPKSITVNNLEIPIQTTIIIQYVVTLTNVLTDGDVISNTAVFTDNWGNVFPLKAYTVVADNNMPKKMFFEDSPIFEDGFESGDTTRWSSFVADRQGRGVKDGTQVRVTNSSNSDLTIEAVITDSTKDGWITGTISSNISQTVTITLETTNGLNVSQSFVFGTAFRYLPIIIKS